MVNMKDLNPGMMVKIVDKWAPDSHLHNGEGLMDRWLGQIMTVKSVDGDVVIMEEDYDDKWWHWLWYPEMLDCIVEQPANVDFSEEEFLSMLCD